jgi:SAM-dependent methyltransferase
MSQIVHSDVSARTDRPPLSRVCALSDWDQPRLAELMEEIAPGSEPTTQRHRKLWEFALGVEALERAGMLGEEAMGLSIGAGHEPIVYYLANRCRWIFATDLYGAGGFSGSESDRAMLVDPDLYAPYPYRRRRLTVVYMDALDLRFEDGAFDFAVSFGSIEHFGGREAAAASMAEMARVLRPGGLAFVTTEVAVDGGPHASLSDFDIFTPETLSALVEGEPRLEWFDGVDLTVPEEPDLEALDLGEVWAQLDAGAQIFPHVRLEIGTGEGRRRFTSVSLTLRRRGS